MSPEHDPNELHKVYTMETIDFNTLTGAAADRLHEWLTALGAYLPNFVLAAVVLVLFYIAAKIVKRYSRKYLLRFNTDKTISGFLSRLLFLIVLVAGIMLVLSILDLTGTVTGILAGLGIAGLALGFAFQDTAANFMSGVYITFRQPYAVGDVIETNDGITGYVIDINLRVTKVRTFDGPVVYVPNRFLFQENFTNFTEHGKRRLRLACGVSYGEDLEKVERVTVEALSATEGRLEDEPVTVHWQGFGDSSVDFTANIWVEYAYDQKVFPKVKNDALKRLKKAFDENDIMIPFPIRTLDFGIKGGVRLKDEAGGLVSEQKSGE